MYIIVRAKNGVAASDRLDQLLKSPIFTGTGRTPYAYAKSRVVAIFGDVSKERLGLKDDDWSTLVNEVNVVFNSAATIRFNNPVGIALGINCLSTMSILQLCRQAKQLSSFVHVSTCYTHCQLSTIDEKFYPTIVTAEHLIEMTKWLPSDKLDKLCKDHLFDGRPNSYVFTKALAENYLNDYGQGLPIAVGRLSIVGGSRREPELGFIDVAQANVFIAFTQALGALR